MDITFDYEGDAMRSTVREGKQSGLRTMRAGIGMNNKKLKEGFDRTTGPEFYKIDIGKKQK